MVQTIQREFRSRGAKADRGIAKSLGHGVVIPGGEHAETRWSCSADEMEDMTNHQSGLFALSSGESDMKLLEDRACSNDPEAKLALNIFAISVRKVIGAYVALLGGVDLLVFTVGINSVVQDNTQKRLIDVNLTVVVVLNETQFPEFVHEKIYSGPGCANHLRQRLLRYSRKHLFRLAAGSIACEQ